MLNYRKIEWTSISLEKLHREIAFPFPVNEIGYIRNHIMPYQTFHEKLEITIRLSSSEEKFSTDVIEGKQYRLRYPNAVVKIPGVYHSYEVPAPRDAFYFSYHPAYMEPMRRSGLCPEPPLWEFELTSKVKEIIRELQELMDHSREYGAADRMDLLAFQLLEELLFMRRKPLHRDDFIESKIQRIASYFQINFNQSIDFSKLCLENGFSRRSFFRHWNRYFNRSPMLYLQELKLKEAGRLLTLTGRRVGDIASSLNFQDTAYFCAIFKKQYGMTPLQYRRRKQRNYL